MFDDGEDVSEYMNTEGGYRLRNVKRVNVDIPVMMLQMLDIQAKRMGVARQALIKFFLAEKLGMTSAT